MFPFANIPMTEVQAVVQDVKAIFASSGISQNDVALIQADLLAIRIQYQANRG